MNEPMYPGAAAIGKILGGGVDTTEAFNKGATQRATLEEALAKAKIKRDEAMARTQVKQALIDGGMPPETANMLDAIMRSGEGSDYSAGQLGIGRGQENDARAQAMSAAKSGNVDLMNNMLAVTHGAPMTTNTIDDGYQLNPHAAPTSTATPTGSKLVDIMADQALVGSRNAAADASRANADLRRDHKNHPDKYHAPSAKRGSAPTLLDTGEEETKMVGGKKYVKRNGKWGLVQ